MKRRHFLKTTAAASAAWILASDIVLAQVRWEEEKESIRLDEADDAPLSAKHPLGKGPRNWSPKIAIDDEGLIWLAWITERDGIDTLLLTNFDGTQFGGDIQISEGKAHAQQPAIHIVGDSTFLAWVQISGMESELLVREIKNGAALPPTSLAKGNELRLRPVFVGAGRESLSLFCEHRTPLNQSEGIVYQLRGEGHYLRTNPAVKRSWGHGDPAGDASRFSTATDTRGAEWLAYDELIAPGSSVVYLNKIAPDPNPDAKIPVTHHPAANLAPSLAVDDANRLWISFHSNRRDNDKWDLVKWFQLRCYKDGALLDPVGEPAGKNLDKEGTDQSFEFTRVFCTSDGKVIVTGRASHNFLVQWYHGDQWSPLYRLPEDGWGGRGQYLEGALDKDENLWVVRRDLNVCVLQKIVLPKLDKKEPVLVPSREKEEAAPKLVNIIKAPKRWPAFTELEGISEPLNIYYGDIHGHTWASDGMGDVDEWYFLRRDYYEHDFASLTDHDTFVGQSIPSGHFDFQKAMTEHFNQDGRFATIFGQEYTTARYPKGVGHKCIYSTNQDIPLFDHDKPEYENTAKLYAAAKKWNALVIPHHVGWTGSDWENFDPELQPLVEIISNHGRMEFMGNRPIPHRGGMRGHFVQDVLAKGLRVGIIGGSDAHGLIWHHGMAYKRDSNATGLACVLAPELTRQAIFDALRKRRCFGTTGIKPSIDFRINGHLMGEEIETKESKVSVSAAVAARNDIKWLTVVKNNKDIYEYGGEGYTTRFTFTDEMEPGESYYYLRVEFEGTEMAWTSPIWVKYQA